MTTLKKQLGLRVREIRKKRKFTQAQLAENVHLSVNMIGYIERGDRFPSSETFENLAKALGVKVHDLFCFPPVELNEDPENKAVVKAFRELIEDRPASFVVSIMEIIKASNRLKNF